MAELSLTPLLDAFVASIEERAKREGQKPEVIHVAEAKYYELLFEAGTSGVPRYWIEDDVWVVAGVKVIPVNARFWHKTATGE